MKEYESYLDRLKTRDDLVEVLGYIESRGIQISFAQASSPVTYRTGVAMIISSPPMLPERLILYINRTLKENIERTKTLLAELQEYDEYQYSLLPDEDMVFIKYAIAAPEERDTKKN